MKNITLGRTEITAPQNGFGALPVQRVSKDTAVALLRRELGELRGLPCEFGCFTPDEALRGHQLLTGALASYTERRVVELA